MDKPTRLRIDRSNKLPTCSGEARSRGRPRPPAAGGCAFRGAKMALQPITDAAHLVHGPACCDMGSWAFRPTASSGPKLYRQSFSTDLNEIDIVLGGEAKLLKAIGEVITRHNPPAVFVYQTCIPHMIGDDVASVCRKASGQFSRNIIAVDVPGMTGKRPYGGHQAAEILLEQVIGSREPEATTSTDVALIGEFNLAGEMDQIRRLLAALGIRVLASISGDGRFADVATAHRARAAVVLCSQGLKGLAEGLFERYDVPFFFGSFYGTANTSDTLRRLARLLAARGGPIDLPTRTERFVGDHEADLEEKLAAYREQLSGKRALLLSGGVKSWSIATTLRDAGLDLAGVRGSKATQHDRERLVQTLNDNSLIIDTKVDDRINVLIASGQVDIVLGGGDALLLARRNRIPWLEINHGRSHSLCGYDGALNLLEEVRRTFASPVWHQARQPPPWMK